MNLRNKILIFGVIAFVIIALVITHLDTKDCRPVRTIVDQGLSKFYSNNSISKLTIKNGKYGKVYGNFDSLVVVDPEILNEIRERVLGIKKIELTRYGPKWTARLEFTMQDKTKFEIWLNKTDASGDGEYKIYKYGECEENYALGSKALGDKILGLIDSSRYASR